MHNLDIWWKIEVWHWYTCTDADGPILPVFAGSFVTRLSMERMQSYELHLHVIVHNPAKDALMAIRPEVTLLEPNLANM